ncbi:MAG: discoidin domain-containing protein [Pseudomonadota bacterium]
MRKFFYIFLILLVSTFAFAETTYFGVTETQLEAVLDLQDMQGAVTDSQLPATVPHTDEENTFTEPQNFDGGALFGDPTQDAFVEYPIANQAIGSDGHVVCTYNVDHTSWVCSVRRNGILIPFQTLHLPDSYAASFSDGVTVSDSFSGMTNTIAEVSFSSTVTASSTFSATNDPAGCSTYSADLCTGGTATAESFVGAGNEASKAFDNNVGVSWISDFNHIPSWVMYDFGSGVAHVIILVRIRPDVSSGNGCVTAKIEGSTDASSSPTNWTTLVNSVAITEAAAYTDVPVDNSTAYRHIRVTVLTSTNSYIVSAIAEIEMKSCAD